MTQFKKHTFLNVILLQVNICRHSDPLRSTSSDPNMTTSSEFFKSSRRSLRFSSKKDKDHDKVAKKELLISEAAAAAEKIVKEQEKKEEEELAEIDELYTLPELPHTPLSGTDTTVGWS